MAFYWIQSVYNLSEMLSKHWDHPSAYPIILKLPITRGNITLIPKEAIEEREKENYIVENKKIKRKKIRKKFEIDNGSLPELCIFRIYLHYISVALHLHYSCISHSPRNRCICITFH